VHDADRYYVGRQDRRRDEDRHQDHLRQEHQLRDRRDVHHQDHQVRRCEEQNQYVDHQGHLGHRYEDHQVHQYEDHQGHQDLDDCQDQDGNRRHQGRGERHQGRGERHQGQDGNQDEIHQELRDRLEEVELVDQLPTLGLEEAEWVERLERLDREEACRLVACLEELTVSTAQVALTALG
jgi:hypothetical protein